MDPPMASSWSSSWEEVGMGRLSEGCISHVLSLTSPKDTCRLSGTARAFRSAANSDEVWEGFLPRGYGDLLSRAVAPVAFQVKKELYFRLCRPTLIDDGRKSFVLEKSTGKLCFMVSARELFIVGADNPEYWNWISLPHSRFSEVAELRDICWLGMHAKISIELLSPKTPYVAYLIFKLTSGHYGFEDPPTQEGSITVGTQLSTMAISLFYHNNQGTYEDVQNLPFNRRGWVPIPRRSPLDRNAKHIPHVRMDGWMEVVLGEFFNDDGVEEEVTIRLQEIWGQHWKRGLIVEGIELRPKNQ